MSTKKRRTNPRARQALPKTEAQRKAYNARMSAIGKAEDAVITRQAQKRVDKRIARSARKAGVEHLLGTGKVIVTSGDVPEERKGVLQMAFTPSSPEAVPANG